MKTVLFWLKRKLKSGWPSCNLFAYSFLITYIFSDLKLENVPELGHIVKNDHPSAEG